MGWSWTCVEDTLLVGACGDDGNLHGDTRKMCMLFHSAFIYNRSKAFCCLYFWSKKIYKFRAVPDLSSMLPCELAMQQKCFPSGLDSS